MRLHFVDGTFELFRAHYSKAPEFSTPGGQDFKATVGVVRSMMGLLADPVEKVTHLAVAFDNPIRSFRNDLFADYKTGDDVEPALLAQFDAVEAGLRALGVVVWSMDRWEADDALATAAVRYGSEPGVEQVRIMTPDKDLGQAVRGTHVVQVDRMRQKTIDETALRAARGIGPSSIPDLLALVGDTADGIPGVPGFGTKTAAALLGAYGHLEAIPERASQWPAAIRGAERLAATLNGMRAEAVLYRQLATLATDVPLAETLDDLRWGGVPEAAYGAWCAEVGLKRPGT